MLCKGVGAENPWFPQTDLWRLLIHRMVFKPIEIVFKAHATSDRLPNSYIQQFDIQFQIFGFCIHDSTKPIPALHKEWLIYLISQVHNVQIYLDYHQFTKHQSFFLKNLNNEIHWNHKFKYFSKTIFVLWIGGSCYAE